MGKLCQISLGEADQLLVLRIDWHLQRLLLEPLSNTVPQLRLGLVRVEFMQKTHYEDFECGEVDGHMLDFPIAVTLFTRTQEQS